MTTNKVCLYTKTLVCIHLDPNARYAIRVTITRVGHKKMGNDLVIKSISTGTVTRMDLDKASLIFFPLQVFLMWSLFLLVECFFFYKTSTIAFMVVWRNLTMKVSNGSTFTISVKFALITLTVCKSHCFYYSIYYKYN